jgi:hypothetical protein
MKRTTIKKIVASLAVIMTAATCLTGCSDANSVDYNITKDSENFKTPRRIIFINGVTDKYLLTVEGYCNIKADRDDNQLETICKVGDDYKKDILGLSDNVTYMVEQLSPSKVSKDHYKIVLKPETIIPDVEMR